MILYCLDFGDVKFVWVIGPITEPTLGLFIV